MNTLSRRPSAATRPITGPAVSGRGPHAYPCCPLAARPHRHDPAQHPLTWEDLLGRR
ncbi:hypothetical protein KBY84_10405 [Cyanobium sp. N.Huapi 1H5]|uniref:hypothetical protein n=1 Tax=Cyanobium sp. N.Huapi 1H5 TaxID=2823719 RepID=UPI0020CEFA13|nr:hypothetical protein [Cyanobium sp. N.Huapi 1H5]MCP9837904.1 hypothetical protein [Cyanobium sp. N.Huapi 1H5]